MVVPPLRRSLLLLVLLRLFAFAAKPALSITTCPSCGTQQVPYPLSTNPTCGDQNYNIICNTTTNTLLFPTLNNTYTITSISSSIQRLTISPSPLIDNTCVTSDYIHQGVQLNSSLPFNITSSNTIMYLNCSDLLLSSPLDCNSTSLCHTYVNNTAHVDSACGASLCCTFRAGGSSTSYVIRVRESGCMAYTSFVNLNSNLPVSSWPDAGMEIQWVSPREPVCASQTDCDRYSTCGSDSSSTTGVSRCFCNAGLTWDPIQGVCDNDGSSTDNTPLIAGLTAGLGSGLILAAICIFLYKRHSRIVEARQRLAREREELLNANSGGRGAKLFTGKQLKKATNNFAKDRLLGAGGYGEVYKGILDDGSLIAVKCAKVGNTKGTDQVLNEVGILCQVNHRSLVKLMGCCVELEQPTLVYEFIPNGTLSQHLKSSLLSWTRRLQIAHDTAHGLAYLHSSAVPPIYHRDVKSSNILLDEKLNAKVADFGLSRLAETDMSHISTCAQGTLGYLDPEYYRNYQLTDKSDVYSFGVVLLELLTSQKAIDFNRDADDVNLAVYVQRMVEEENLMNVVDPMLKEKSSDLELDTMKALGLLALGCLEERRQNRPSMKEVTEEIEYIISIATARASDA
ncbi:hypothetical protein ACFE04_001650 [Oxalis oulophora]